MSQSKITSILQSLNSERFARHIELFKFQNYAHVVI